MSFEGKEEEEDEEEEEEEEELQSNTLTHKCIAAALYLRQSCLSFDAPLC